MYRAKILYIYFCNIYHYYIFDRLIYLHFYVLSTQIIGFNKKTSYYEKGITVVLMRIISNHQDVQEWCQLVHTKNYLWYIQFPVFRTGKHANSRINIVRIFGYNKILLHRYKNVWCQFYIDDKKDSYLCFHYFIFSPIMIDLEKEAKCISLLLSWLIFDKIIEYPINIVYRITGFNSYQTRIKKVCKVTRCLKSYCKKSDLSLSDIFYNKT